MAFGDMARTVWFKLGIVGVVVVFYHSSQWPAVSLKVMYTGLVLLSDKMNKHFSV